MDDTQTDSTVDANGSAVDPSWATPSVPDPPTVPTAAPRDPLPTLPPDNNVEFHAVSDKQTVCRHDKRPTRWIQDNHEYKSFCKVRTSDKCRRDESASGLVVCTICDLEFCRQCWNLAYPFNKSRKGSSAKQQKRVQGAVGTFSGERRSIMERGRQAFYARLLPGDLRREIEWIGQVRTEEGLL